MHKSKLSTFVIDCQGGDIDSATEFWSQALGRPVAPINADDGPNYRELDMPHDQVMVLVQKVEHPSRIHLDIESDDIEAEVKRLEGLGARRVEKIRTWWVMEAPTGQRFCVVRPQRGPLGPNATEWPAT
jgi:Glyoxalase-like domain